MDTTVTQINPSALRPFARTTRVGLFAAILILPGCGVDLVTIPGNNNANGGATQPPPASAVTVRLINLTDAAVQADLYVSTNALADPVNDLFVDDNGYTEMVGVAATGLLAASSGDTVDIKCGDDLVIGTSGGRFLDDQTGEQLGTGSVRVLQRGLVFDCGDIITLFYRLENGAYTVDVTLE